MASPGAGSNVADVQTRAAYRQQLHDLAQHLVTLGGAVWDNIGRATDALVRHDLGLVDDVLAADDTIDEISRQVTQEAIVVLARESPVATELAYVVSLLRLSY